MKIEFQARWANLKQPKPIDQQEKELQMLIHGHDISEDEIELEIEYHYTPMFLDTDDIKSGNEFDAEHTVLRTYDNDVYTVKTNYEHIKQIYMHITGQEIRKVTDFVFEKAVPMKRITKESK